MKDLPKIYNAKEVENKIYNLWEEKGLFSAKASPEKVPYAIVIPPPNITGILHMGHALNNTIQDILIRYKRMQGCEALWMPGTDHAGIATQNVVERKLARSGKGRHDLGREEFLDEVWKWREEYGGVIIKQLKFLGASCDWKRERFTMDERLSGAVIEAFIRLYKKGLVYRGNYIINWCPRCQTALSDEEVEHRDVDGYLYYIRYPVKLLPDKGRGRGKGIGQEYITVATTRPETMLGDTAIAVNPTDERYKKLIGGVVILPILNRELRVIADNMIDPKFGTGAVKVTPAHDPKDFQMGKKHGLEELNIMCPDGILNENAGDFEGMDRFEAREALLEVLSEKKLIEKVEPHKYAIGHCYRCHTIVEPYLSKQWFVKMKPLAEPAIKAVEDNRIKFYPKRWRKVYLDWMYGIRDWCISRQIWWGHRIPVYYCRVCNDNAEGKGIGKGKGIIVSKLKPEKCPDCGATDIVQDPDVLDTWFSSWLWPFSTFGWPFELAADNKGKGRAKGEDEEKDISTQNEEFKYFYPTACLVTAQEIIFFWVARMIMAGLEFCEEIPFRDVYIHGTVRDKTGTKMSKSLGNTIDPLEIIKEYGTDALRFSIISITAAGQDVFLSKERFESGRNFSNKLWNVSRFLMLNLKSDISGDFADIKMEGLSLADRWLLTAFFNTVENVTKSLDSYRFNDAANMIHDFLWHKYCDWYVEISKASIKNEQTQLILYNVLKASLQLLHPVMPFITEEIWQVLDGRESIMTSSWPKMDKRLIDTQANDYMEKIIVIITAIRNIRAEMNISRKLKIDVLVKSNDNVLIGFSEEAKIYAGRVSGVENILIAKDIRQPKASASNILDFCQIYVPLQGKVDIAVEKARLNKNLAESEKLVSSLAKKLGNNSFIDKAPKEVVEQEKQKELLLMAKVARIKETIENLT
jgi:valyl-tRNA synthetase